MRHACQHTTNELFNKRRCQRSSATRHDAAGVSCSDWIRGRLLSKIFDALRKAQGEVASYRATADRRRRSRGGQERTSAETPADRKVFYHPGVLKAEPKQLHVEETHVEHLARLIFHTNPTSTAADKFRLLRMRLDECWKAGKLKSVLVSSPLPGDGKSTTALNLATALAEKRTRSVLLVDADLHHGSITQQLNLEPYAGLAECLHGRINPISAIRRIEPLGWHFLPSGKRDVRKSNRIVATSGAFYVISEALLSVRLDRSGFATRFFH